jgi:4-hydroxy-tetrahydrodipicolinate synthase
MREAGASIAVATGPYYLPRAIQEAEHEMVVVADHSPLPVVFYNIPEMVGYGLRGEWVQQIAKHPNVCGYKDSSNDFEHHQEVLDGTDRATFTVLMGKEGLLKQALESGARGIVVSLLQADPGPFVRLTRAAEAKDWESAAEEQERVRAVVEEFLAYAAGVQDASVFGSLMAFLEEKLRRQGQKLRLRW